MLGSILFILKVLGIFVLCVLGLVFLILLLVLFAPFRYSSEGSKYADNLNVKALVTYLNPLVRVKISYPDETIVTVRILGITVFPGKPKEKTSDVQREEKAKETREQRLAGEASEAIDGKGKRVSESSSEDRTVSGTGEDTEKLENQNSKTSADKQKQEGSKSSKLDTARYYASLFTENKELIFDVLKTILKALKTILPHKCRIHVVCGTGQADTTGYIYAAYCSLKEYLPGEIYFEPVWTESHIEGEFFVKGKIRIVHFLVAVIKIIANKKVRLLIKKLRRV